MGRSSISSTELCSSQCCLGAFKNWLLTALDAVRKMHIWFLVCVLKSWEAVKFFAAFYVTEFYEPTSRLFIVFHCLSLTAVLLFVISYWPSLTLCCAEAWAAEMEFLWLPEQARQWICSLAGCDAAIQLFTGTQTTVISCFSQNAAGVPGEDLSNRRPCL